MHHILGAFIGNRYLQRFEYAVYRTFRYLFAYKVVDVLIRQFYLERREFMCFHIHRLSAYLAAAHLLHHQGCKFQRIHGDVGVGAALVAERCICAQSVATRCAAHRGGLKICTLQKYVGRVGCHP